MALGFREMSAASFAEQKRIFLTDKEDQVRLAVLRNLWRAHQAFPEVRRLVKEAAGKDRSPEVRKAATAIIARYPKDYFN
jgi:sulfur relay (sulfurtransferase) DsrC/TusE family protein